ncbi:MAG: hypothetical protein SF339_15645 [Blastocatellia bacterium]|nr:hypothetical protein [Blastocatellia bacterium]
MLMADTMAIFFVILGFLLAFPGLWLLCRGLWPRVVADSRDVCERGLFRPFLIGLPAAMGVTFVAALLGNLATPGKIAATTWVCFFLVVANCGVAGLATLIGARLAAPIDAAQAWRATLRGGIVLELSYLLPILGWFGLLPISLAIGLGAMALSLARRLRRALRPVPVAAGASAAYPGTQTIGAER